MFLYCAVVLVLIINKNAAAKSDTATTTAFRPKHDHALHKGELAKLIHYVKEAENEAGESFDGETVVRKVTHSYGIAQPLDLNYFDILHEYLKSNNNDELNKKVVSKEAHASSPSKRDPVRVHLIKNPEVIEQYRKNLRKKHVSTSSDSDYDDSLEYDRNAGGFVRRNAVFRLDSPSNQVIPRENPQLTLRIGDKIKTIHRRNSRENGKVLRFGRNGENGKEKIHVTFKDKKHDDSSDNSRYNNDKRNINKYKEELMKKTIWDDIKNAFKWDDKLNSYKHSDGHKKKYDKNDYKKREGYDKKDRYDEYGGRIKATKSKKSKSDDWDKPNNSWDTWKPKTREHTDYKRDNNDRDKPKRNDDWDEIIKNDDRKKSKNTNDRDKLKRSDDYDKPKKNNDWDKPKKRDDWDKPKKSDDWDKPKKSDDWDKPKKINDWDKSKKLDDWDEPKKRDDWDKQKKSNDWDKSKKSDDWNKPKKSDDWDKPKRNDWDKSKKDNNWDKSKMATKGIASFEREPKNDYLDKEDFKKEETKKTTNEWDRAFAKSRGGSETANEKPFVPVIPDYYNRRPRIHENPAVLGFKPFGRTSIPFVGKKGIYEEK